MEVEEKQVELEEKICKRCGSKMIQRVAKRGENMGDTLWGCSQYKKCRYIEN